MSGQPDKKDLKIIRIAAIYCLQIECLGNKSTFISFAVFFAVFFAVLKNLTLVDFLDAISIIS